MLNVLYDRCFAAIQHQVSCGVLRRVQPLSTGDSIKVVGSEKWKKAFASGAHNRIVRDVMSEEVLQYIKDEILHPNRKELKRAYFGAVIAVDPMWRQAALYDLLLKCRWEEIRSVDLKRKKMMQYEHIPVVTEMDAKAFIKSGRDPLALYMRSCDDAIMLEAKGNGDTAGNAKSKLKYYAFMSHITATDMVDIVFESISNTIDQPNRAKGDRNVESRISLRGDSVHRNREGPASRRGSRSRSDLNNFERRYSRNSGMFAMSRDMDDCSDTMSVGSSISVDSRSSFSAPPGKRRSSKQHKHSARKLVEKKKY